MTYEIWAENNKWLNNVTLVKSGVTSNESSVDSDKKSPSDDASEVAHDHDANEHCET